MNRLQCMPVAILPSACLHSCVSNCAGAKSQRQQEVMDHSDTIRIPSITKAHAQ